LFSFILIYSCVRSTHPLFLLYPADKSQLGLDLVCLLAASDSVITMTDSISETALERIGVKSLSELLLLESVKGLKALLSIATHKKLWSKYMALCSC
jgi:hypothetical protein